MTEVIKCFDKGEHATKMVRTFGVRKTTTNNCKKNHAKIEQFHAKTYANTLKKLQNSNVSASGKIDEALYLRFRQEIEKVAFSWTDLYKKG